MNKRLTGLIFLVGILNASILIADMNYWPMFRYDSKHTGRSPYPGPLCDEKWHDYGATYFYSSPVVRVTGIDTMVYIGNKGGYVYGFKDLGPGNVWLDWSYSTATAANSTPLIDENGLIYASSYDSLYCFQSNGNVIWRRLFSGSMSSPVMRSADTLYIGSSNGALYAINPASGSTLWSYVTGASIQSSPAIADDGTIYVGSDNNNLYAISPNGNGSYKWHYPTGGAVRSSPSIGSDGTIYFSSLDKNLYAINPDGSHKWTCSIGARNANSQDWPGIISSPAIGSDGTIYIGAVAADSVFAINPNNGNKIWATYLTPKAGKPYWDISSSPALSSNGYLYIGVGTDNWIDFAGGVFILNQTNGSNRCFFETYDLLFDGHEVWDSPSVGPNYTVYFGDCSGKILWALQTIGAGIEEIIDPKPLTIKLHCYPNPFTRFTVISLQLSDKLTTNNLQLNIYDLSGRVMRTFNHLTNQPFNQVVWDGTDNSGKLLPGGIYYYTAQYGEKSITKKVLLLR